MQTNHASHSNVTQCLFLKKKKKKKKKKKEKIGNNEKNILFSIPGSVSIILPFGIFCHINNKPGIVDDFSQSHVPNRSTEPSKYVSRPSSLL